MHRNLTHQNAAANLSAAGACAIFRASPQTESKAVIEVGAYKVAEPDGIETPAMLVFADQLDHNIKAVGELAGGSEHLFVHVKTHKSIDVTRKQLASGVAGFKCATLKELEMTLDAGAREAILSYPLVQKSKVLRFAELAQTCPEQSRRGEATVSAIASAPAHMQVLGDVAQERQQTLRVMIDLNVGMFRTGAPLDAAIDLYRQVAQHPHLSPGGLHLYDGHETISEPVARQAAAERHICDAQRLKAALEGEGLAVPRVVGGGSFSSLYYARAEGMHGSPGTCVYWDAGYGSKMAELPFKWAALVLTQVIDRYPEHQTLTTDLGTKAISDDGPLPTRAKLLQNPKAELTRQNEEHGVFSWSGPQPEVGDYLLAVPWHVCPTTIRYPGVHVIDAEGQVADYYLHSARDRDR